EWRPARAVTLAPEHQDTRTLLFSDTQEGKFAWDLVGGTLLYAADLVPEIADDVVNVDRAMRWGFNWQRGPFQFLDYLGPKAVIEKLEKAGQPLPRMLKVLKDAGAESFYRGEEFLGTDGTYHPTPAE
ncbi:MAG TPA: 3-hydroxyacyl-CoA dehydrogenase, partial [Azospirillaceae bacterium]|nr:3-hydroxyacyl-CoA dehydrogenase [Azospirillaceae bacterium]